MRRTTTFKITAAVAAAMLLLSGCLASSSKTKGNKGANSNTSKKVTIMTGFSGPQATQFENALKPYAKSQGIDLSFALSSDFNNQIVLKVKANQLPDIALFPQPGIMKGIAAQGKLADLDNVLDIPTLKKQLVSGLLDAGTLNGKVYAIPPSINVKSLVFYPKKAWAAAGYKAPTTLDGLLTLTNQIKSQGKTPWCIGIESAAATGWPATDCIENLVLNFGGIDQYNKWVAHTVKFDSPLVKKAAKYFQTIFSTPGFVNGGQKSISADNFGTAGNAMFNSPPGCYMFKQGNFITQSGFFPSKILANTDANIGAFFFPGVTAADKPVEGGGDVAALFSGKNQSAIKIMKFMLSPTFCTSCAKEGGYISPFKNFDQSNYSDNLTRQMAQIAYSATAFAFDGSDSMPGAVGSGSFWTQMTAWVNGSTSLDAALKAIDASWPAK